MDPERFKRIKDIFVAALDLDPGQRTAFLKTACQGDDDLLAAVERLLDRECDEDSFLEKPAGPHLCEIYSAEYLVGARIGQYRVLRLISSGGMGMVYEALQEHPERTVALKVMKQGLASPAARQRFVYESQILASLTHPGIAQVIEAGTHRDAGHAGEAAIAYFVMEYIPDAKSITEYASGHGLSPRERLDLFLQACDAVHYGHQRGIIHRDLKPGNMLVDRQGRVKIIDFGVARATDSDVAKTTMLTEVGQIIGTIQYMSPEQCEADSGKLDVRSDVYALGMVLYELLCEALPYDVSETSLPGAVCLIREAQPERPSAKKRFLRGDLETVVLKALEKERSHRYQSVAELSEDVRRFLAGQVIRARPAGPLRKSLRWTKRNPKSSIAVGIILMAVVGFIGYMLLWSYPQIKAEKEKADQAYSQITRLSDVKRLANLEAEEARLWPAWPEMIPSLETWLERTEALLDRLPIHRRTLSDLRAGALPYDEDARRNDRETHPRWLELTALMQTRETTAARGVVSLSGGSGSDPATADSESGSSAPANRGTLRADLAEIDQRIAMLRDEVFRRRTWEFEDLNAQWQHNTLLDLVTKLDALGDPEQGMLASVRQRLDFATTVMGRSIEDRRAEWDRAIASIADKEECPAYQGLLIKEQVGYVPLGRDPDSGLWEFSHLQTGDLARRGADGRLVLTEETGLVLVLVPGGAFTMGTELPSVDTPLGAPNVDPHSRPEESPAHRVTLEPFLISKYEMTQGQWLRFTRENPSYYDNEGPEHYKTRWNRDGAPHSFLLPVEQVSWTDCVMVLTRLGLRLPTEAEWEYAARAGTTTIWWTGNSKESLMGTANIMDRFYKDNSGIHVPNCERWLDDGHVVSAPVGSFRPNPYGLHDICGNVWEWCRDDLCPYQNAPTDGSAHESDSTTARIARGGGWPSPAVSCRSARRRPMSVESYGKDIGIRPAATVRK